MENFKTSDIHEAVMLRCMDYDILEYKVERGKVFFVFADSEKIQKTMIDYMNRKIKIEAKKYKTELESLRSVIKTRK